MFFQIPWTCQLYFFRNNSFPLTKLRDVQSWPSLFICKTQEAVVQRCSIKKGVLSNFTKFTGKHLCQSLVFNKVAGLRPATLLKKRLWHRCFLVNFVKFLRTPFFIEHLWWLLLKRFDGIL